MQISLLNGRIADIIDVSIKNTDASSSVIQNEPVAFCVANANSIDGISVTTTSSAAATKGWAGIARSTIAWNGYGTARAWGYQASAKVSVEGQSVTITAGDACVPRASAGLGITSATAAAITFLNSKYAICLQTVTLSAAQYVKVLMRAI